MKATVNPRDIILNNLPQWERALKLFEKTTGLMTSLYVAPSKRVLGPFSTYPLGQHLLQTGAFIEEHIAHRSEVEELIPLVTLKTVRIKKFANVLSIICIPVLVDDELIGAVYAGWVFDHFADPIECDRLGRLFGSSGFEFLQIARMQAPVSQDKLKIFEEMLTLIVSTLTEQLISLDELKEASKVKDELLSLVSHELRTPLTSLLLRIQMLKANKVSDDKVPSFLDTIEENALIQSQLIEELLDAAKIMVGNFSIESTPVDLKTILNESIEMVRNLVDLKGITVQFKDMGNDYRFTGDPQRLKQCFWSILANAVKLIPAGGKIRISLIKTYTGIQIRIEDSGKGFDQETLPKIFDRFNKTESAESTSGLGLGMHIVKKIIELHKGHIEIVSKGPGENTGIEIFFPVTSTVVHSDPLP